MDSARTHEVVWLFQLPPTSCFGVLANRQFDTATQRDLEHELAHLRSSTIALDEHDKIVKDRVQAAVQQQQRQAAAELETKVRLVLPCCPPVCRLIM